MPCVSPVSHSSWTLFQFHAGRQKPKISQPKRTAVSGLIQALQQFPWQLASKNEHEEQTNGGNPSSDRFVSDVGTLLTWTKIHSINPYMFLVGSEKRQPRCTHTLLMINTLRSQCLSSNRMALRWNNDVCVFPKIAINYSDKKPQAMWL